MVVHNQVPFQQLQTLLNFLYLSLNVNYDIPVKSLPQFMFW